MIFELVFIAIVIDSTITILPFVKTGGPLMLPIFEKRNFNPFPFFQIGIVSYGAGCGKKGLLGAYTNIQHYSDWIQAKLKINPKN